MITLSSSIVVCNLQKLRQRPLQQGQQGMVQKKKQKVIILKIEDRHAIIIRQGQILQM
tara:strand:+ start:478 stop:651 length:174 start_codon:yes stop_codon:yes gene_type:complete